MDKYHLHKAIADKLLFPLWQCVDKKFKTDNPKDIWRYFENFVKTSATSPDLSNFFGSFKRLCPFEGKQEHEKAIVDFILYANSDDVLEILRGDDCALVILLVSTGELNEARKQNFKQNSIIA